MAEIRHLRAFVAVAEELNFTRAAARLYIAQQAVSRAISQLERELGVVLLDRTTHAVTLTRAGLALLDSGREAIAAFEGALEQARVVGLGLAGTVRVGLTPAVGAYVRSRVAIALRDGAPDSRVSFHEVWPANIGTQLREHQLDVVLARTFQGGPDVVSAALPPTRAVVHLPGDHRLARAAAVRLRQLDGERLLCWNQPGTTYTDLLLGVLSAAGAHVQPVLAAVLGGGEPPDPAGHQVVALVPEGSAVGDGAVEVPLAERVDLPLEVLWLTGSVPAAVARIRRGFGDA